MQALQCLIALTSLIALVIVGQLRIRPDALLRFVAPEQPVAGVGHVAFRQDEHTFPAQPLAAIFFNAGGTGELHIYALCAAASSARFTATFASCTLYPFWLRGCAP